MNWLEWAIIAFIVLSIGWIVWRGGQANPESTGALGQKFGKLSGQVGRLDSRLGHMEQRMTELEHDAATTKDIERLEQVFDERIGTVRAEAKGHRELSEATNRSVERIERIILEKGLGK